MWNPNTQADWAEGERDSAMRRKNPNPGVTKPGIEQPQQIPSSPSPPEQQPEKTIVGKQPAADFQGKVNQITALLQKAPKEQIEQILNILSQNK